MNHARQALMVSLFACHAAIAHAAPIPAQPDALSTASPVVLAPAQTPAAQPTPSVAPVPAVVPSGARDALPAAANDASATNTCVAPCTVQGTWTSQHPLTINQSLTINPLPPGTSAYVQQQTWLQLASDSAGVQTVTASVQQQAYYNPPPVYPVWEPRNVRRRRHIGAGPGLIAVGATVFPFVYFVTLALTVSHANGSGGNGTEAAVSAVPGVGPLLDAAIFPPRIHDDAGSVAYMLDAVLETAFLGMLAAGIALYARHAHRIRHEHASAQEPPLGRALAPAAPGSSASATFADEIQSGAMGFTE